MTATVVRVQVWVRRHLGQLLVTGLLVGIIGGLAIGLAAGTRRTSSAPDRFTTSVGGDADFVIVQLGGPPLTAEIDKLVGVSSAQGVSFVTSFLVSPTDGSLVFEPEPYAGDGLTRRSKVVDGRFPNPSVPDEFTVNAEFAKYLADQFGTRVGDRFEVSSFDQQQVDTNAFDDPEVGPAVPPFSATLVGITEAPWDFDDPSKAMVFSPAFLEAHPTVGVVQTLVGVYLDAGTDASLVIDAIRALPGGAGAYQTDGRVVSPDSRRAVRFQVTALWIVTAVAALAAAVVVLQLVSRMATVADEERTSLITLGWRPRDVVTERAIEAAVAAMIAAPVAALTAYALSPVFPLGTLRPFEPHTGPSMDWLTVLGGLAALLVVAIVGGALAGRRRVRLDSGDGSNGRLAEVIATSGASMALATGARMLTHGRGGRRWLHLYIAGVVGMAGVVGSGVVGLSLTTIVDNPARWGVNYDALFGNPYVSADTDIVAPIIDNPDVAALTGATIGSLTIGGDDIAVYAFNAVRGGLVPTVLEGRSPSGDDEIGLGAEVARHLDVGIGDEVAAVGPAGESRSFRVVGITVTPDAGGAGSTMTFPAYAALNPAASQNLLTVNYGPNAPADASDAIAAANFSPPGLLKPPFSVSALQRVTAAPFLLAIVLLTFLVVASAYLLPASVRARRQDLGVLRALGCDGRQLRAIIHWQTILASVLVLLVGVPTGIVAGRWVVKRLTQALGIVPGAVVPLWSIAALAVGVVVAANVLAVIPARSAARTATTSLLRDR